MKSNRNNLPSNAKRVFSGVIFDVWQWEQKMFDGTTETFEKISRPNTANVIATIDGEILIQEQYQPHWDHKYISIPGGRCDGDEDPLKAAKRELLEETGCVSEDWHHWFTFAPKGKIVWSSYIYIARNCIQKEDPQLDAGEKITTTSISFEDFLKLYNNPQFYDSEIIT